MNTPMSSVTRPGYPFLPMLGHIGFRDRPGKVFRLTPADVVDVMFVCLHPSAFSQKAEIIVEQFRAHTAAKIVRWWSPAPGCTRYG
ncbi:hypothetical protein Rhow_006144 [Rhodococcus wratislaviensis]|uniref:Uncharacterized protein n=1 Tax=Rhodococcus wratislaviensis TaxID=44752 RepID=A0A402CF43_RHOWR|nr:hypothetical protein [Rhodococcus wratislaviensis]GCE42205.1 hypothetical protein Rhow_006144 [Rhodococcus wratislaviensis]